MQALFESFETALYYKTRKSGDQAWVVDFGYELLADYQGYFLTQPVKFSQVDLKLNSIPKINARVSLFDLSRFLDLPVPFYAAFAFGGELIPLFFKQRLTEEGHLQVQAILKAQGIDTEIPDYHPVI